MTAKTRSGLSSLGEMAPEGFPYRVLVVDDDPMVLQVSSLIFRDHATPTHSARDIAPLSREREPVLFAGKIGCGGRLLPAVLWRRPVGQIGPLGCIGPWPYQYRQPEAHGSSLSWQIPIHWRGETLC